MVGICRGRRFSQEGVIVGMVVVVVMVTVVVMVVHGGGACGFAVFLAASTRHAFRGAVLNHQPQRGRHNPFGGQ